MVALGLCAQRLGHLVQSKYALFIIVALGLCATWTESQSRLTIITVVHACTAVSQASGHSWVSAYEHVLHIDVASTHHRQITQTAFDHNQNHNYSTI